MELGELLAPGRTIPVNPAVVAARGSDQAIVLQQLMWHLEYAEHGIEHDGWWWFGITYTDLAAETGLSVDQARRAVRSLEDDGYLVSCQPEGHNRRKWYRIDLSHEVAQGADPRLGSRGSRRFPSRGSAASSFKTEDLETAEPKLGDEDPPPPARPPRRRTPRDDIFDALVAAFGPASTKSRASFYGRAVTELIGAGATPDLVRRARIAMSRRGWDHPTPEAMVKHWDSLIATPEQNPAASRWWENEGTADHG